MNSNKIDMLDEKYKNAKANTVEDLFAFSQAKVNARRTFESLQEDLNSETSIQGKSETYQRQNYNQTPSLDSMDAINFNVLLEYLREDDNVEPSKNQEIKADSKKPEKENKKTKKSKKEKKEEKNNKDNKKANKENKQVLVNHQNVEKNKIDDLEEKQSNDKERKTDEKEWELDAKYRNGAMSFDDKIKDAKAKSLASNLMMSAAQITHESGRKVEFNINSTDKLSFSKIDGDTFAFINGEQANPDATINSLKDMVKGMDFYEIKDLKSLVKQVAYNPTIQPSLDKNVVKDEQAKESKEVSKAQDEIAK